MGICAGLRQPGQGFRSNIKAFARITRAGCLRHCDRDLHLPGLI